jgi:cyclic beta-1,2-glucan synthetase
VRRRFLTARALAPGEDEAYLKPEPSGEEADLYDHCCRAIDRSLTRGPHGLPLMGTGDWNDGMNRVGREGRGESVWLGFFLYKLLGEFLPLCDIRGDAIRRARYAAYREALGSALECSGWDGGWYRRAYYDDGTPLGGAADAECRIDALAQAWAVISGAVPRARAERAMDAVEAHLIDDPEGLIRLLTPPFVDTPKDPGYIKGYLAGVRENGGQYTHAACWVVMAMAMLGRRERAAALLERLSPVWHTATPERVATYRLEPYALAADIYAAPPHVGRGGWSWYTGSAAWMYRVGIESILGLRLEGGRTLELRPCIPADWPGFRLRYRLPEGLTECAIEVENGGGRGEVIAARLDGAELPITDGTLRVRLPDRGGSHRLWVRLG